jgi:predicted nucleic acid-binding protein
MKKLRVYLDTSVIGGCFDDEFKHWSNGLFEDFKTGLFLPVISSITSFEIEKGAPAFVKEKYLLLFDYNVEIIKLTKEADELAEKYIKKGIISSNYLEDALHIAIATIANIDVLVSWNFKHIVHYDKIRLFNGVNIELGYKPIAIYSPREVTGNG